MRSVLLAQIDDPPGLAERAVDPARLDHLDLGRDADPRLTVREWLEWHGQTARLIELLWEPLAVASLNQSIDEAAGEIFGAVLRRTFTSERNDSSLGLVQRPLDELYTEPSRVYLERRGGAVRANSQACVHIEHGQASVHVRSDTFRPRAVICAAAWFALPAVFQDRPAPLAGVIDAAESTAASPIVTVNLWFDRPVTSSVFVGLPGRANQWVFDKRALFGEAASHIATVSSGAAAIVSQSNPQLVSLALDELKASGKIRWAGISVNTPDEVRAVLRSGKFESVQVRFNLADRRMLEVFPEIKAARIGLIVREPLANGLLLGKYEIGHDFPEGDIRRSIPDSVVRDCVLIGDRLDPILNESTTTRAQLALKFVLAFDVVSLALAGIKDEEQLEDDMEPGIGDPITKEEFGAIEKVIGKIVLGRRTSA